MESSAQLNKHDIVPKTTQIPNEKTSIVIIESSSVCRTLTPKDLSFDTLYKKGGFINNDNFSKIYTWDGLCVNGITYNSVSIWGKLVGKSNNINKFVLPTPLNNHKLFGACIVVHSNTDDKILSIDSNQWKTIYESLSASTSNVNSDVNSDVCISEKNNQQQQSQVNTIKNSKLNKRVVSDVNPSTVVDSNNTDIQSTSAAATMTTKSKPASRTPSKPPVKRNKKKTQDTELDSADTPAQYVCELTTEKYVFTDEE